jgi:hypothetical protein
MKSRIEAILSKILIVSIFAIPIYWIYLFFVYLSDGKIESDLGSKITGDLISCSWLINPDSWFGLHQILSTIINLAGPGILPLFLTLMIFRSLKKDTKNDIECVDEHNSVPSPRDNRIDHIIIYDFLSYKDAHMAMKDLEGSIVFSVINSVTYETRIFCESRTTDYEAIEKVCTKYYGVFRILNPN